MLRLSLDALQVLDAIARRGSFAAAAEEVHRTTSTLSYTVKKLEEALGVKIFDRSGHRAVLTRHGRLLLEEGRALLDAASAIERRMRLLSRGWEAELSIAVNDLVPMSDVIDAVGAFYAQGHPTRIKLKSEVLGGVWESLVDRRADLVIAEVPATTPHDIASQSIGAVTFVFATSPSHPLVHARQPLRVAEIRKHRVVVVADSSRGISRSTGIASANDVLTVDTVHAKLAAQMAGLGVGFLPVALAEQPIAEGRLIALRVSSPKAKQELSLAWRAQESGPALRWFTERLQSLSLR